MSTPVFDDEFGHNIVKVAVDPQGDSQGDPQENEMALTYFSLHLYKCRIF